MQNLKTTPRYENKEYVLDNQISKIDLDTATHNEIATYKQHVDDTTKVSCIMIATTSLDL